MGVLEFLLHLDQLLYEVFLPEGYRRKVADVNIFLSDASLGKDAERQEFWSYLQSAFHVVAGIVVALLYTMFVQDALPADLSDVKVHCAAYMQELPPLCSTWGPEGASTSSCYPFGRGA